jgi:hypothetical protein
VRGDDTVTVRFGVQTDVQPLDLDTARGRAIAGYLAKYVTKDAGSIRRPGQRAHLKHMDGLCRDLAARAREHDPATEYGLLRKWARALGFRGHFSSKSRTFSLTLTRIRRARRRFAILQAESQRTGKPIDTRDLEERLLADDAGETTLVVGSWTYQGTGWPKPGDATLAAAAAARAREHDQWRAEHRKAA